MRRAELKCVSPAPWSSVAVDASKSLARSLVDATSLRVHDNETKRHHPSLNIRARRKSLLFETEIEDGEIFDFPRWHAIDHSELQTRAGGRLVVNAYLESINSFRLVDDSELTPMNILSKTQHRQSTLNLQPSIPTFRADLLARINPWSFRLPGLAKRREDIEPNLDYELKRYTQKTGQHISFNKGVHEKFLAFALEPANRWPGNFRDLNAMVVRMATLSDGGRITEEVVEEEIARCFATVDAASSPRPSETETSTPDANETFASMKNAASFASTSPAVLTHLLGPEYATHYDSADLAQLAHIIAVCRESTSATDAAKKLYAVSRKAKSSSNDSDRLTKYLARFGLKFRTIINNDQV